MVQSGSFVAYNDLAPSNVVSGSSRCSWNQFTHGRHAHGAGSGILLGTDGKPTNVSLSFQEHITDAVHSINNAPDVGPVRRCTPAFEAFGPCMCPEPEGCDTTLCDDYCNCDVFNGDLSYNDKPGWYLRYILEGLNPACSASLTLYIHRGPLNRGSGNEDLDDYGSRYTLFTLEGIGEFHADKTSALTSFDDGQTLVIRGGRNVDGHVARWTSIKSNGTFSVVASHDRDGRLAQTGVWPTPHPYKAYAGGLLKLEQICLKIMPAETELVTNTSAESELDASWLATHAGPMFVCISAIAGLVLAFVWYLRCRRHSSYEKFEFQLRTVRGGYVAPTPVGAG